MNARSVIEAMDDDENLQGFLSRTNEPAVESLHNALLHLGYEVARGAPGTGLVVYEKIVLIYSEGWIGGNLEAELSVTVWTTPGQEPYALLSGQIDGHNYTIRVDPKDIKLVVREMATVEDGVKKCKEAPPAQIQRRVREYLSKWSSFLR